MAIFNHTQPKITETTCSYPEFVPVQYAKNQFITSVHSSDAVNVGVIWLASPFFNHAHPKNHFLICVKFYQHTKNLLISSVISWNTVNFRFQGTNFPHPFLTMPNQFFIYFQKWTLTFQKKLFHLLQWKSFKNDEKCFLFQLKCSFCSQDIQIFLSCIFCRKNSLLRKIWLKTHQQISKKQCFKKYCSCHNECQFSASGFPIVEGALGGAPSHPMIFFENPPSKPIPPWGGGVPTPFHLQMKPPIWKNKPPTPIEKWNTLPWNDSYKKQNK